MGDGNGEGVLVDSVVAVRVGDGGEVSVGSITWVSEDVKLPEMISESWLLF